MDGTSLLRQPYKEGLCIGRLARRKHQPIGTASKDNLAVLHNQNDMVRFFGMSAWVTQSDQKA